MQARGTAALLPTLRPESDCDGCDGGVGNCDHGCACFVSRDPDRGVEVNPDFTETEQIYVPVCNDGVWTHETCKPRDSIEGGKADCLRCTDKDD